MSNPLRELASQLGLSTQDLADRTGIPYDLVGDAMTEPADEPLKTFLRVAEAMQVRIKLQPAAPLAVWFDAAAIEEAWSSSWARNSRSMDPRLPKTRGELRCWIRELRNAGTSYGDIVRHFEANWIPTVDGLQNWRRSTIGQHLAADATLPDDEQPLGMGDEMRVAWRRQVTDDLMCRLVPGDPFAVVRYAIEAKPPDAEGRVLIVSKGKLPACVKDWILTTLAGEQWLAGRWGECDLLIA